METKNSTYLILSIILLILSVIGGYFLLQNFQATNQTTYTTQSTPKIELIPTDIVDNQPTIIPTVTTSSAVAKVSLTPTKIPTQKITPTPIPTKSASASSSPNTLEIYSNSTDDFSVSYSPLRKFIQDTETSGNRYTFSSSLGNFAVHVSSSGTWSWIHPGRQFNTDLTVSGQPTFRYDIAAQTIVDLQSNTKNYTIQCVHNGVASVKEECETFISSFKLL